MDLLKVFLSCDIETAKVLNLISILMDSRLFFEFIHEMYDEKLRIGETEITDRDLNVFFANKAMQSEVVAGWTDTAVKKLKQCFCRMMYEAGLLESSAKPRIMRRMGFSYKKVEELGVISPVVEISVAYRKQVFFDDEIRIRVGIKQYTGISLEFNYEFFNASRNEICTTAYSRHCFLKDGKLIALKKELPELNRIITDCL